MRVETNGQISSAILFLLVDGFRITIGVCSIFVIIVNKLFLSRIYRWLFP